MWERQQHRTAGLFILLIAALLVSSWMSYEATARTADREKWVAHSYAVLDALDTLSFTIQTAQASAADYVLTGDRTYLAAYRDAASQLEGRVDRLQQLTAETPAQQSSILTLRSSLSEIQHNWETAVSAGLSSQHPQATSSQAAGLIAFVNHMKARESALLERRALEASENLRATRYALLLGGGATIALLLLTAYVMLLEQKQRNAMNESRGRLAAIIDSSQDAILSKTLDGTITSWNGGAERLYGYRSEEMVGKSIYEIIPRERKLELQTILEKLGRGERVEHLETVRNHRDGRLIDVDLTVSPLKDHEGRVVGASAIARDITQRKLHEESLRQLSVRIMRAQDDERRRIARDIHDSTVQKLALLSMSLSQLQRNYSAVTLQHAEQLTRECVQELRTLSYVLHPPMLDELGLASALKIYAEGVAQRSGLAIAIDVDPDWPRLEPEVEMALFRVAQEGLSNVLRHSGSKSAEIKLSLNEGLEMSIRDEGSGIKSVPDQQTPSQTGVGIPGMGERLKQLGGALTIDSGPGGTTLIARLPRERRAIA